ncbi:MAG: glutamine--fructose-6-phosphate aminotransferase [Candidatus Dadabacteria bacterium RIFCSPHIGHO2_12_FULL_53_21]|nr:MAG: glutamine--fructose-6-phosphate aminotransferase [Candidatus Dadabacteria bacterium RIFCSPHIGHO2_12_FULL_53_21]
MCGIVGYVGDRKKTVNVLLDGLTRLEYRGYDSSGIALMEGGHTRIFKSTGKLSNLKKKIGKHTLEGLLGIGHTRWATHGDATEKNAHPHISGGTSVVHNGIIENYSLLKGDLIKKGYEFYSDTDTEVLAHLIESCCSPGITFEDAVRAAFRMVEGSYAVAVISDRMPDKVIATRKFSPLIVALGDHENYLASDVPAILPYCRNVIYLEDGDVAVLEKNGISITDLNGDPVERNVQTINWDPVSVEKCGYRHFMIKEIHEQPQAVLDTMRGRFSEETGEVFFEGFEGSPYKDVNRITALACGTSYHASLIGKYMIETLARVPVQVEIASEFRYRNPILDKNTLAIAVSQSGETADTSEALFEAKACGAKTLGITNVLMSKIARDADRVIYTHAGPEIGVASTKAFTTQLVVFYLLSIYLGRVKKQIDKERSIELIRDAIRLPQLIQMTLRLDDEIKDLAKEFFDYRNFLYLGRGINYPVAFEGALKLKEVSYIHAEGYAAGEMKHGPIALIDDEMPVVLIAPNDGITYKKILGNLQEVRARRGKVIFLTSDTTPDELMGSVDRVIEIPGSNYLLSPVLSVVPLQLLAYHIAVLKGTDVDQPRNLAKVVTVE